MRALLASLFALTFVACSHAANPSFSSFFTNHFTTNSFIIKAKLNTNQFDAGATNLTITITNVSGITGGSKWTNWPDGILRVIDGNAVSGVAITNLSTHEGAVFNGAIGFGNSFSTNLVAGANDVSQAYSSYQWITGASANPADSTLRLSADVGAGGYQFLLLENYSQNSGFTLFDNDTLYNDPSQTVRLRGNWAPTEQGDSILLIHDGRGWRELARESVVSGGDGNVFGNGTPLYLPIWLTATSQGDSPVHIPSAGSTNAILTGTLFVGESSFPFQGATHHALVSVRNADSGLETDQNGIEIYSNSTNGFGSFDVSTTTNLNWAGVGWNIGANFGRAVKMNANASEAWLSIERLADGEAMLTLNEAGQIIFGPNGTNVLFRIDNALWYENQTATLGARVNAGNYISFVMFGGTAPHISASSTIYIDNNIVTKAITPDADNAYDIGQNGIPGAYQDLYLKGVAYIQGFNDGTGNHSRGEISHSGTNGVWLFDSIGAGTAGTGQDYVFSIDTVPVMSISPGLVLAQQNSIGSVNPLGTYGLKANSTTAATAGQQQNSPAVSWTGQGWSSTLGASESFTMGAHVVPTAGTTHSVGVLQFGYHIGVSGDPDAQGDLFGIDTRGPVIIPTITKAQKTAIAAPMNGMLVNQSDNTPGLRAYINGAWVMISTVADP